MTEAEASNAPEGMQTLPMTGMADYKFSMTISALDCTGCGSCANVEGEELPQIEEHPVAFAMYILSPNNCVINFA